MIKNMENIDNIIAKSILGTLSKEEYDQLDEWRKEQSENEKIFQEIFEYSKSKKTVEHRTRPLFKDYIILKQEIQKTISEEIKSNDYKKQLQSKQHNKNTGFWYWSAAACVLLFIMSLFYFKTTDFNNTKLTKGEEWITRHTLSGQKISLTLPDGTRIKLNSNAAITFPKSFKDSPVRKVHLDGEAFFEVTKMDKPFIVYSGDVETRVLGTSFNIRKENDKNVAVAVLTGKVSVQNKEKKVTLLPGQLASVKGGSIAKKPFDKEEVTGWKDGILRLSGNDFDKIEKKLEAWYGVDIEVSGKIKEKGFHETYYNAPLYRVLEGLGFIGNFDYKIDGKNVFLKVKENNMPMDN